MDTHDRLRSSEDEPAPLIPHSDSLELSDEEIRRLQEILNSAGGEQVTFLQAKYRGLELLGLTLMLLDPKGYEQHLRHPLLPSWRATSATASQPAADTAAVPDQA